MGDEFPMAGIDFERANAARMYDYWLGGGHNFAVDREQAAAIAAANPGMPQTAFCNRGFLGRVVRWCVEQGLDQFLDLGSGVPTVGNVHEVAQHLDPDARVAYVDFEPVAVAHAREILTGVTGTSVTSADLRDASSVLASPGVADLLDFDRPVAVLAIAVLHFVPGDLGDILMPYRERLVPGSVVAINHASWDLDDPQLAERVRAGMGAYRGSATEVTPRSRTEITAGLSGLDLVDPGLVDITDWPETQSQVPSVGIYAAVARVP